MTNLTKSFRKHIKPLFQWHKPLMHSMCSVCSLTSHTLHTCRWLVADNWYARIWQDSTKKMGFPKLLWIMVYKRHKKKQKLCPKEKAGTKMWMEWHTCQEVQLNFQESANNATSHIIHLIMSRTRVAPREKGPERLIIRPSSNLV